jgi:hypothetical protein
MPGHFGEGDGDSPLAPEQARFLLFSSFFGDADGELTAVLVGRGHRPSASRAADVAAATGVVHLALSGVCLSHDLAQVLQREAATHEHDAGPAKAEGGQQEGQPQSQPILQLESMAIGVTVPVPERQQSLSALAVPSDSAGQSAAGSAEPVELVLDLAPVRMAISQGHIALAMALVAGNFGERATSAALSQRCFADLLPPSPLMASSTGASAVGQPIDTRDAAHAADGAVADAMSPSEGGSSGVSEQQPEQPALSAAMPAAATSTTGATAASTTGATAASSAGATASANSPMEAEVRMAPAPTLLRAYVRLREMSILLIGGGRTVLPSDQDVNEVFADAHAVLRGRRRRTWKRHVQRWRRRAHLHARGQAHAVPVALLRIAGVEVAALVDASMAVAATLRVGQLTLDDVRPARDAKIHASLRHVLLAGGGLESDVSIGNTAQSAAGLGLGVAAGISQGTAAAGPGQAQAADETSPQREDGEHGEHGEQAREERGAPIVITVFYGPLKPTEHARPGATAAAAAKVMNLGVDDYVAASAHGDMHPLSRLPPPSQLVMMELVVQDLALVVSPLFLALSDWAGAAVPPAPAKDSVPRGMTAAEERLERWYLSEPAFKEGGVGDTGGAAAQAQATQQPAGAMSAAGAGEGATLASLQPPMFIRVSAQVVQPAIYLVRTLSDPRSEALALTTNLRAWVDVSSTGELGVAADISGIHGMRLTPGPEMKESAADGAAAGYHSDGGSAESELESPPRVQRRASPVRGGRYPMQRLPAHLKLREPEPSDFLAAFALHAYFSLRPALTLPAEPLPLPVPSMVSARLSTADSICMRVAYSDGMLVMDAVNGVLAGGKPAGAAAAAPAADKAKQSVDDAGGGEAAERRGKAHGKLHGKPGAAAHNNHAEDDAGLQLGEVGGAPASGVAAAATERAEAKGTTDAVREVAEHEQPSDAGDSVVTDPAQLSFSASIALPMVVVTIINDISGMDLPLAQLTVEDLRASALAFHVGGRTLATAGLAVSAEYYNVVRAVWEPLLEHWSVKLHLLKPQPLQVNVCTGALGLTPSLDGYGSLSPDGRGSPGHTQRHLHWQRGVGGVGQGDAAASDVRIIDAAALYEVEDSVSGLVPAHLKLPAGWGAGTGYGPGRQWRPRARGGPAG